MMSALTDRAERMSQDTERTIIVNAGREAMYYRDEQARRIMDCINAPEETPRIEAWTELHLQWGMRLRVYAEIAVKLELYKTKEDYLKAVAPERKAEDGN